MIPPLPEAAPPPPDALVPAPAPSRGSGLSTGLRRTIVAAVVIVIVLIGIIGYAVAGFAYSSTRVSGANKSLNTVISHQNRLNTTFKDLNAKFSGLNTGATSDPMAVHSLMVQFVANARSAGTTIDQDDESLVSARATLNEQSWLTLISKSALDREVERIDHARKALTSAKTLAADYILDGGFFQAYADVFIDIDAVGTRFANADLTGSKATVAAMKTHADKLLQLSAAPGLPKDLHDLAVDLQTLVTDLGKLIDAAAAADVYAITSAEQAIEKDVSKASAYDFNKIVAEIDDFYRPLVDTFNAEMAKATA